MNVRLQRRDKSESLSIPAGFPFAAPLNLQEHMQFRSLRLAETFAAFFTSSPGDASARSRFIPRGAASAALVTWLVMIGAVQPAHAVLDGVFGGGPYYKTGAATHIAEIKSAGFSEAIVWNIEVKSNGDLNFNGEFPLCSNGSYIGASTHSDFVANMTALHQGSVRRVTFSIGSSNVGDWQDVRDLVNSQGTGTSSILYKNFNALLTAIPAIDAFDFDDENCYDTSTMVKFGVMLSDLGAHVVPDPYTNSGFWTGVVSQINSQRPGCVDAIHLQCYSGGGGNNPGTFANFGSVPVYPGLWDHDLTPSGVQSKLAGWKSQYGISGGWMWMYDDFVGNGKAAQYASAINAAFTTTYETENLTAAAVSGPTPRLVSETGYSNGQAIILDSTAVGNYVTFKVPAVSSGVYDVTVGVKNFTGRGIWQLYVGRADNFSGTRTAVGSAYDEYSSSAVFTSVDLGTWTPSTSTDKWFQFYITGKNSGSNNYSESIDYIKLTPK